MMVPIQVTSIPTFLLFNKLGWLNTYLPLIVPYWSGGGAFFIFLLRQFMRQIPKELDDAAKIDGCNAFGLYWYIILPLIGPALASMSIFIFRDVWNDLWGPLIYLTKQELWTLARAMLLFRLNYTQGSGAQFQYHLHWLMAMATITLVPVVIFYLAFQRYFVSGITLTGLKG
jgi:ABC-type glycerol-3-phosphate transport system permease component